MPAVGTTKAVLFYFVCSGDHAQNAAFFFKPFADQGIHVYALDRRGFGMSEGLRGQLSREFMFDDHWAFIDGALAHGKHPASIPKFVWGISLGGVIATTLLF
jgi:alpha-beta hydrolase superfamily lysophospholipase